MPKYPKINVKLTGTDGNAFAILGACRKAARKAGLGDTEVTEFYKEATSGDYSQVLATCCKWFNVR